MCLAVAIRLVASPAPLVLQCSFESSNRLKEKKYGVGCEPADKGV